MNAKPSQHTRHLLLVVVAGLGLAGCFTDDDDPGAADGCADAECEAEGETSSADELPDLPQPECAQDSDCSQAEGARFCVDGSCLPCSSTPEPDVACWRRDRDLPVCVDDECVTCSADHSGACDEQFQYCDVETLSCAPCSNHDQCPGGAACDILTGQCFPANAVWHIDGDGGRDFLTITEAIQSLSSKQRGTFILHELDGEAEYTQGLSGGSRTIAVLAAPGEHPAVNYEGNAAGSSVGTLYLRNVDVQAKTGIHVGNAGAMYIEESQFYVGNGPAIRVEAGSRLIMKNSMVRGSINEPVLLRAGADASFDIVYSTFVGVGGLTIECPDAIGQSALRNSIVVTMLGDNYTNCPATELSLVSNLLSGDIPEFPDNTPIGPAQAAWFFDANLDLHLGTKMPIAAGAAARWQPGDPTTDIDGHPRTSVAGAPGWAGADVP